jgi:hypothetical protein
MRHKSAEGLRIELCPLGAVRLRRPKLEALWPHDETSREREGTAVPVDVA